MIHKNLIDDISRQTNNLLNRSNLVFAPPMGGFFDGIMLDEDSLKALKVLLPKTPYTFTASIDQINQKLYLKCNHPDFIRDYNDTIKEIEDIESRNSIINGFCTDNDVAMARVFAFNQHDIECNHWYDKELRLPYSYHLQLVADVGNKFLHLLPIELRKRAMMGCYLHDIVEDARMTYNKLAKRFGESVAYDACKLTTNVGGLNRAERAGDWYYEGINEHIVTVFIKFCDRIANMEHSITNGSKQCKMYADEMDKFLSRLDKYNELNPMREHLRTLEKLVKQQ